MTLGPLLFSVEFPLLAISTIFLVLRFYCRQIIIKNLGSDDWIMLVALVHSWGMALLNVYQVHFGTGTHIADLLLLPNLTEIYVGTLKVWYIYNIIYLMTLFCVKFSILAFYRRLSPAPTYQLALQVTGAFVAVFTVVMILVTALECPKNPRLSWSPKYPEGCHNRVPALYTQAAINIFTDIVILLLPLPSLLKLQVNRAKRIALILIFSTGGVAVIASIVRINALYIFQSSTDLAYDGIFLLVWSSVEINVAIISASAPSLQPLVKSIIDGSMVGKSGYSRSGYAHGGGSGSGAHTVGNTGSQQPGNQIPLESYSGPGRDARITTNVTGRGMGESEESIVMKSGIMRTTDVRVEIVGDAREDARSDVESVKFDC